MTAALGRRTPFHLFGPRPSSVVIRNSCLTTLDLAKFVAYIEAMKTANIGELKDNLSKFITLVEKGEAIEVCKRNIPIARIVPYAATPPKNRTKLGCGLGTVKVLEDLTEPLIPEGTWDMHRS